MGTVKRRWIESMEPKEEPPMGAMKDFEIRIRSGGDDAIAAVGELTAHLEGEIERLREAIRRLADQDATLSVVRGNVVVEIDATLTDAEREAVERAVETLDGWQKTGGYHSAIEDDAATLRGLLERTAQNKTDGYVE
jgi:hypothetical protein